MRAILFATAAIAAISTCAHAEDATVEELVVTSTRLPLPVELVAGARVIDEAEIRQRQSVFLTDLLATVPGVAITRNGAYGGVATVRIRGAGPDKTLVVLDGVPLNDPADPNGAFDFANLQLADITRVETLSGPQGSLWGSQGIGGVIALTSRELDGWRFEGEAGSMATARLYGALGVRQDAFAVSGSVSGFRTDGISKAASGSEDDGYETWTTQLSGRLKLSDRIEVDGRLRYTEAEVETDGFPAPLYALADTDEEARSEIWSGLIRARAQDLLGLDHEFSLSAYDLVRDNLSDFPSRYLADRQVWRWTAARGEPSDPFAFVIGAEREAVDADLDGRLSTELSTTSVFGVARWTVNERLSGTASLRYDAPDAFESETTARVAVAGVLGAGFTLTGSFGQGFKTPTISQYICDFCFTTPVPLRPEKAEGYDLRLGWRSADGRLGAALTGYRLTVQDQISYSGGRYVNIARTRSNGVEAEADLALTDALRLKFAYAQLDSVDATTGASLLRVPDHSGAATLFWTEDRWEGALTLRAESNQADADVDGFSRVTREGFVTADAALAYAVNERLSLTARIENLADEDFQESYGYGEPGRAVFVGLRLRN